MLTAGGALTVILIESDPLRLPLSITAAVMTCALALSVDRFRLAPEPMLPSLSEDQAIEADKSPSSVSLAEALKPIASPSWKDVPSAGLAMVTLGAVLPSHTLLCASGPCCEKLVRVTWSNRKPLPTTSKSVP